jgi:hypothetical protein
MLAQWEEYGKGETWEGSGAQTILVAKTVNFRDHATDR